MKFFFAKCPLTIYSDQSSRTMAWCDKAPAKVWHSLASNSRRCGENSYSRKHWFISVWLHQNWVLISIHQSSQWTR